MKKAVIGFIVFLILFIGAFLFLLSKASPDNAPQDIKVIELPDSYEK